MSLHRPLAIALFVVGLVIGFLSCGQDDVTVEIDGVYTEAQKAEIRRAGGDWNTFTSRKVEFADDGEWLILWAPIPENSNPKKGPRYPLGHYDRRRALIRISPSTPDDQIYAVALHEIGHALGLQHTVSGVMNPNRQVIEFNEEDFAECRRVGACD